MPVSISFPRPKATLTNTVNENVEFDTPTIVGDAIELRVFLDNLTIDVLNIVDLSVAPITWTAAGTSLTGIAGSFSDVRIGDVITSTSGTDFASSQTVASVSVDGSTLTFAPAADGNADSGQAGSTLTFTPGDIDSTLYYIRLTHSTSGNNLTITPSISCFDGSLVADGAVNDGSDEVTYDDGVTFKTLPAFNINLDSYLTAARVAKLP